MRHITVFLLLAALFLAGCGGGDSDGGGETTAETTTSGELSITEFGEESEGEERAAILAAERGYLTALGEKDFTAACERLAESARTSLGQLAGSGKGADNCAAVLPKLLSDEAFLLSRQAAQGEVTGVRVEDEQAFVVYRAPGAELFVLPMVEEDGEWRPTSLTGSVLVPDLN